MDILYDRTKQTLKMARDTYGYRNQVLIAIEELNELSCVLAKYPRFDTHEAAMEKIKEHVLEECGDVLNALDHVQAIFNITDEEMVEVAAKKGDRLLRWLISSDTQEVTTLDRAIDVKLCPICVSNGSDPFAMPCIICNTKPGYKGFSPIKKS